MTGLVDTPAPDEKISTSGHRPRRRGAPAGPARHPHHRARGPPGGVRYLRTQLELTAGNLSQHLSVLETAGLIVIEKGYAGRRGRSWITLTAAGNVALAEEIARLKLLITRVETASGQ